MAFEKFKILHINLNGTATGSLLEDLKGCLEHPFIAETCSRQIYMFEKAAKGLPKLIENNMSSFHKCEVISGESAYLFALMWLAGYKSKKYNHNDRFVLGKARKAYKDIEDSDIPVYDQHRYNMNSLFRDASELRRRIQDNEFRTPHNDLVIGSRELFEKVCQGITRARISGETVINYDLIVSLSGGVEITDKEYEATVLLRRFERMGKKISTLQKISATDEGLDFARLGTFNKAYELCVERHMLKEKVDDTAEHIRPKISP
ncbi:MAG: hypothetical protein HON32_06570 [Francisellaceae bacterium]|jgi:hypothetical protein|nr:hypothetical protein [Francisellaceae bacterium]MBT6539519.1 hypothetical protein [Francisellaceae bacterium]